MGSVDPLAEKDYSISPYAYCKGNPIRLIDPNGLAWKPTTNENSGEQTGYEWYQKTNLIIKMVA